MREVDLSKEEAETLVVESQQGDSAAFARLYDYFFPRVYRYVSFRVEGENIEDVVSDVFLKVVQYLQKYTTQKNASFSAWVFRIAHNQVVDHYRKKKEVLISLEGDEEFQSYFDAIPDERAPGPDEALQQVFESEKMRKNLSKLKPNYREILELKYLEDFSNKEIAQISEKTEGNIRIMQLRALKDLRVYVENDI